MLKMELHSLSLLALCLIFVFANFHHCNAANPIVYTNNGIFLGEKLTFQGYEVNQFLGVPYAEPPVGDLRFQKPKAIRRPSYQIIQATTQPPSCPQFTKIPFPWYMNSTYRSEDCLHLNIWTPSDASVLNKKAVFYWIHGGGFRYGAINFKLFSGEALAALGDIIVVTVNYRVGSFGFLTTGTEEAPGNVAIWDMLEGLKWVNKYIDAFGGDISKITIAGQSAGAIAVGLLTISPLSRGLYTRAIVESEAPTNLLAENNAQNLAFSQQLAEMVGCANDVFNIQDHPDIVLGCLRNLDAETIGAADGMIDPLSPFLYVPQYGDELLPENSRSALKNGDFYNSDLLIGVVEAEGSIVLTFLYPEIFGFQGEKDPLINKTTGQTLIRDSSKTYDRRPSVSEAVVNHYLPESVPENSYDFVRKQVHTSIGDPLVVCPSVYYAEEFSQKGNRVYYYYWVHRPSNSPYANWMGTVHLEDVQFLFGQPVLHPDGFQTSEVLLSRQVIGMWSSFVKTGNPGESWPLFSKAQHRYKIFGELSKNGTTFEQHLKNCDFFRSTFGFE